MADPTERRRLVASSLAGIIVPDSDPPVPFTVVAHPLDNAVAPAIIISPRGPYIERLTFSQYRTNLTLNILLPRTFADRAMDVFDAVFLAIMRDLPRGAEVVAIGNLVGVTVDQSGIEYMSAAVDISL